jgi:hypothetical protein
MTLEILVERQRQIDRLRSVEAETKLAASTADLSA